MGGFLSAFLQTHAIKTPLHARKVVGAARKHMLQAFVFEQTELDGLYVLDTCSWAWEPYALPVDDRKS